MQCRRRVITGSPALQEHDRQLMGNFERALADGIAGDLGVEPGSLRARVAAAAATAGAGGSSATSTSANPPADPMAIFDEAFVFVQGGVEALQARSRRRLTPPRSTRAAGRRRRPAACGRATPPCAGSRRGAVRARGQDLRGS